MKVDAVSNIGFRNYNYTFGEKQKQQEDVAVHAPSSSSSLMKKVPVIVLLAMNPATLNSAIPMMPETDNPDKIVMLAPEQKADIKSTYVINPMVEQASQQSDDPYGWHRFKFGKIFYHAPATGNDKDSYDLVFFTSDLYQKTENGVQEVYLIDKTKTGSKKSIEHPPMVYKLIYHDIGKENEYCSVMTTETLVDENRKAIGSAIREIAIDDNTANKILALMSDKSEWINETTIKFETTKSIGVQQPIIELIKK